ncbi:MAG: hypothetical protein WCJ03_03965 [Bacteroidales bacterium]
MKKQVTMTGAEYRASLAESAAKIKDNDTYTVTVQTLPKSTVAYVHPSAYYFTNGQLVKVRRATV